VIALTIPDRWRATQVAVTIPGRTPRRSRRGLSYFAPCRSCPAVLLLHSVIASQTSSTRATATFSKIRPSGPALTPIAHCCGAATGQKGEKRLRPPAARKSRSYAGTQDRTWPRPERLLPTCCDDFHGMVVLWGQCGTREARRSRAAVPCVVGVAQHLLGNNPVSSSVRRVMRSSPFGLMTFAGLSPIFTTPSWDRLT